MFSCIKSIFAEGKKTLYVDWLARYDGREKISETREGWSLLTLETEVNGVSKRTNDKVPSLVGSSCRYNGFLSCLGCSSQPSTKYDFPSPHTFSLYLCSTPSNLGRQACWVACIWRKPNLQSRGRLSWNGSRGAASPTVGSAPRPGSDDILEWKQGKKIGTPNLVSDGILLLLWTGTRLFSSVLSYLHFYENHAVHLRIILKIIQILCEGN